MPSLTSLLTSVAFFAAAANAVPAADRLPRHHQPDCAPGTSFFTCGHYDGCFDHDPCAQPPSSTITTTTITATPSPSPSDAAPSGCPSGPGIKGIEVRPSAVYDIFPEHPDKARGPVAGIHLETYANASQVEQVVVFGGIPAHAKHCSVGWKQGDRIDRVFVVRGSDGVTGIRLLAGFPEDGAPVTHASVAPFDTAEEEVGGLDFANWDDRPANPHGGGMVDCRETLYLKFALRNKEAETRLYLGADEDNGWKIEYTC